VVAAIVGSMNELIELTAQRRDEAQSALNLLQHTADLLRAAAEVHIDTTVDVAND
jgi:hypothetical protein